MKIIRDLIPLKMKILNVQSVKFHLHDALNFEIVDQQQIPPVKHKKMLLP